MAIKINGTTVIDDSRNLVNIASGAGSSTTYNAVGTYVMAMVQYNGTTLTSGSTHSGSNLKYYETSEIGRGIFLVTGTSSIVSSSLSGTWRMMSGRIFHYSNGDYYCTLFVRIS